MSDPCIIVRLKGGLGNQLFMYAFAKAMAMKNHVPLKVDTISGFFHDHTYKREYLLDHFAIDDETASEWESFHHFMGQRRRKLTIRCNSLFSFNKKNYIKERIRAFDNDIFNMKIERKTYFEGYWQSYRYFEWIEESIREKFSLRPALNQEAMDEADSIRSCNSVCLGIRRFEDIPARRRSGKSILGPDYYREAMDLVEEKVANPHFFIFTQDVDWAKNHIMTRHHKITIIKEKDDRKGVILDLWLMTLCKHFIIANSTLHWWGVWLNNDPKKIVLAPKNGWSNKDIVPPTWMALEN